MAKFEIDWLSEHSDDALLVELRRVAALLPDGEPLTIASYKACSPRVSAKTIRRRFGGWKEALQTAGLCDLYSGQPVSPKMRTQLAKQMSDADLIEEVRRVFALVGKAWLTSEDFNSHSVTSEDALRLRFGSFRKALTVAGIPHHPFKARAYSDQECFENLAAVWTYYGRRPAYREMFRQPSAIQGKTYLTRWGTWRRALQTFVQWANIERPSDKCVESVPVCERTALPKPRALVRTSERRDVNPGLRFKVFLRDRFRCVACGRSPATHLGIVLHADHIIAVANGGKTILENLQTLCEACNLGKGCRAVD